MAGTTQKMCAWSGVVGMTLLLVGFWFIGGFVPPPSPDRSAESIKLFYTEDAGLKRSGLVLTMIAATLIAPFVAVISTQMRRIEGEHSPLAYTQLGLGMLVVLLFIFPTLVMQAALYRPDRDPQLLLLLNDVAWLPFVGIYTPTMIQNIAVAIAIFKDEDESVFPRWLGWFNVWVALMFLPDSLIYFVKDGAFAWNGVISWWVALSAFGLWFGVMFVMLLRAIDNQAKAENRRAGDLPRTRDGAVAR